MFKRITGVFDTRESGQQAAEALLQQHIAPERLSMLAGAPAIAADEQEEKVGAGETAGAVVGASLAGLSTLVIPGIGMLLGAAAALATLGITASNSDAVDHDRPADVEQMLVKLGFMPEQARGYAEDVRQGRTLLSVDAEEHQTDMIADLMHRYGGLKLEFRPKQA